MCSHEEQTTITPTAPTTHAPSQANASSKHSICAVFSYVDFFVAESGILT